MTDDSANSSDGRGGVLVTWRSMPGSVQALIVARMVNRIGGFSMAFLAVLLTEGLHASVTTAGWIVAAFGVATIPSRLAGGLLLDRIGARATILAGLIGCAATQFVIAAAGDLLVAACGAVGLGLAYELIEPPTQAMVAGVGDEATRPAMFGLLFVSLTVSAVIAGGIAALVAGLDLHLLFVIDATTCLLCAVVVGRFLALPQLERPAPATASTGVWPWRDRRMWPLLASGTAFTTLYMAAVFGVPLTVVERRLGLWVIGASSIVGAVVAVLAQRALRIRRLNANDGFPAMTVGLLLFAVSFGVIAVAVTPWLLLLEAAISAVADVLVMGHLYAVVAGRAPAGSTGRYLAGFGLSWGLATTVAPLMVGQGFDRWGTAPVWAAVAVAAMLLAVAQPMVRRACGIRDEVLLLSAQRVESTRE